MADGALFDRWRRALPLPFRRGKPQDQPDERVLDLFRNRAELKKVLSNAQDEVLQLKDRIKQQEGATARLQEMLQLLEQRLANTETAFQALVFYHLRELWTHGRELIGVLIRELAAQRDERERRQFIADYNRQRFQGRQGLEQRCAEAERALLAARDAEQAESAQLARLTRWWHYFKRRRVERRLQLRSMQVQGERLALQDVLRERERFDSEAPPEFGGLSVESRRTINIAALAYAQTLHDRVAGSGLYEQAHSASRLREPPDQAYGQRATCEQLIADIQRARVLLDDRNAMRAEISRNVDKLRQQINYADSGDTIPGVARTEPAPSESSVLQAEFWEIGSLLLR